jgi:hypothetical protein
MDKEQDTMNEREKARELAEVLLRPAWEDLIEKCAGWLVAGKSRTDCRKHGMKASIQVKMGVNRIPMAMIGKAGGDLVLEPTCFAAMEDILDAKEPELGVIDGGGVPPAEKQKKKGKRTRKLKTP